CGFLKKLLKAFIIITKRIGNLFCLRKFDAVFIQKEILPGCHPFFEFFITRFAKKTVFDFDDSIFLSAKDGIKAAQFSDVNNSPRFTKLFARFSSLTVGNRYLFNIAHKFNKNTTLIPTSINTECYKGSICSSSKVSERINIGWIGSFSTLPYLKIVEKPLISVSKQFKITFVVVGPAKGHRALQNIFSKTFFDNVNLDYVVWNGEKEAKQLASFDIGIAPLPDIPWSRGKCGCKLLQYMALGIPSIVSPVGIHKDIIVQSKNGLFAGTEKEWIDGLSLLIKNPGIRHSFRNNAVETVEDSYSLRENAVLLEKVLKNL
ncbi:MAG: glycosyltransferase, partial [Candidatus Aureabacteria bacterium]|nr:glycosyltransferase [Candidatus Auribacterota bacterium]